MALIPTYHYSIHTDDLNILINFLEKENFHRENSTLSKSTSDWNIQLDLSQSFPSPTIICCFANTSISLPQLLSVLNTNSDSVIPLIVFVESSNTIDWNPLIHLISTYNLSLNIVNDEISFRRKFNDIIQNLVKQKISKRSISVDSNQQNANKGKQVRICCLLMLFIECKVHGIPLVFHVLRSRLFERKVNSVWFSFVCKCLGSSFSFG